MERHTYLKNKQFNYNRLSIDLDCKRQNGAQKRSKHGVLMPTVHVECADHDTPAEWTRRAPLNLMGLCFMNIPVD